MDRFDEMAAQLWCLPQHGKKEMDAGFAVSIAAALRRVAEERDAELAENKIKIERLVEAILYLRDECGVKLGSSIEEYVTEIRPHRASKQ